MYKNTLYALLKGMTTSSLRMQGVYFSGSQATGCAHLWWCGNLCDLIFLNMDLKAFRIQWNTKKYPTLSWAVIIPSTMPTTIYLILPTLHGVGDPIIPFVQRRKWKVQRGVVPGEGSHSEQISLSQHHHTMTGSSRTFPPSNLTPHTPAPSSGS